MLSFHLHRHAGYHEVDLGGIVCDELVGSAQQVTVDVAEVGLRYQAHANLVGDDDEAVIQLGLNAVGEALASPTAFPISAP